MQLHCHYEDCEEKPNFLTTYGRCLMCGQSYCPRHITNEEYSGYLLKCLPVIYPGHMGFCVDCVARHQSGHIKGAIDRKCSRIDCLTSLASVTSIKRMCSYCGRWFCSTHFFTREDLTTELLASLKKFRVADGEGACEDCMKRDPVGAMIVGKKGFLGSRAAEMGERLAGVIEQRLPQIAHVTGESLARGTVEGIKEEKKEIVKVAQAALDAPVKQRIWATVIALVGAQIAALISIAYAKQKSGSGFYESYRWVLLAVVVGVFLITCVATAVKILKAWRAVGKAGQMGQTAREIAMTAFRRALWVNFPVLLLVLAMTAGGLYFLVFK